MRLKQNQIYKHSVQRFLHYFVLRINSILVSNALKPQRRFLITGLTPATKYVIKMEAYNIAGSSTEEFPFMTLTKDGGTLKCSTFRVSES